MLKEVSLTVKGIIALANRLKMDVKEFLIKNKNHIYKTDLYKNLNGPSEYQR